VGGAFRRSGRSAATRGSSGSDRPLSAASAFPRRLRALLVRGLLAIQPRALADDGATLD
jgi:hypothetical protein